MSFLEQLNSKRKSLRSSDTVVTQADGRRFIENLGYTDVEIESQTFGFVVDTKPDKVPAKIAEFLYLGAQDCCEIDVMEKFDIVYVLSVGVQAPCKHANVNYKFVQCLDLPETDIREILIHTCVPFISAAIKNKCNVLVHCNAGVSRSSSVVIGFLMLSQKLSYSDAFNIVKMARCCVRPNCGFEKQLRLLENM